MHAGVELLFRLSDTTSLIPYSMPEAATAGGNTKWGLALTHAARLPLKGATLSPLLAKKLRSGAILKMIDFCRLNRTLSREGCLSTAYFFKRDTISSSLHV
jgi:hypothetical protein